MNSRLLGLPSLGASALFGLLLRRTGRPALREQLSDADARVGLSVLTPADLWSRLRAESAEAAAFESDWDKLSGLVSELVAVTLEVVLKSIDRRRVVTTRLPDVDALIAASAALHDAVLIHRDPHFAAIPVRWLKQELLPAQ